MNDMRYSVNFGYKVYAEFAMKKLESYGIPYRVDAENPVVIHYDVGEERNKTLEKLFMRWFVPRESWCNAGKREKKEVEIVQCINRHGRRLKGLRQASRDTKDWGYYSPEYCEVFYDMKTDELFTVYHYNIGCNEWTEFHNPDVICVVVAHRHYSMQEIADMVDERLNPDDYLPF